MSEASDTSDQIEQASKNERLAGVAEAVKERLKNYLSEYEILEGRLADIEADCRADFRRRVLIGHTFAFFEGCSRILKDIFSIQNPIPEFCSQIRQNVEELESSDQTQKRPHAARVWYVEVPRAAELALASQEDGTPFEPHAEPCEYPDGVRQKGKYEDVAVDIRTIVVHEKNRDWTYEILRGPRNMTKQTCDKPAIPNEIHDSEWEFFESRREWFLKIVNRTVSKIDLQPERVTNVLKRHFPAEIKARIIGYRHEFVPSLEEVAGKAIRGPIEGLEVLIEEEVRGYIPRSELSWNEIENDLADEFPIETDVQAIVTDYDERRSEVLLSIKRLSPPMAKVREDTPAPVQSAPSSASAASPKPNADEKLQAADELQPPKQKVKDIASELGVKPFLLIHDLMNMGIYANQNQSIDLTVAEKLHQLHPKPLAAPQTN